MIWIINSPFKQTTFKIFDCCANEFCVGDYDLVAICKKKKKTEIQALKHPHVLVSIIMYNRATKYYKITIGYNNVFISSL